MHIAHMNRTFSAAVATFAVAILLGSAVIIGPANRVYAHTFQGGESAEFLTMVQIIEVETSLAADNLAYPDRAAEHMEHAGEELTDDVLEEIAERNERIANDLPALLEELELSIISGANAAEVDQKADSLNNLLAEAVQVRIESDQLTNSTIRAVVVASLVDEALEHYGEAVGFGGNMTDMSEMGSMNMTDSSMGSMGSQGSMPEMQDDVLIVSEANYQSSLAFAQKAEELYGEIRAEAIDGTDSAIESLDAAFPDFVSAIEGEASAMEVMRVAHIQIHPNLMTAYDLQIIPEFPLPLLLLIPALAGAVLYGRLGLRRF